MTVSRREQCTTIIEDLESGGRARAEDLIPLVYEELRELAHAVVRRDGARAEIQPTMLVHDAYLRLVGREDPGWNGRGHFFGAAAQAMRRILIEQARKRQRLRHGGGRARINLSQVELGADARDEDLLAIEDAVQQLERIDPRKGEIVNLRFFAGRNAEETAALLEVSLSTIEREWRFIKSWLQTELSKG